MRKLSKKILHNIIREEVAAIFREEDEEGSEDEVEGAKEQGMKSDVQRVAKFMFKNKQLGPALSKIKGNVEAAQLLGLLAQELGVDPGDIGNIASKAKKGMESAEEVKESRYHRTPYTGTHTLGLAFEQAIAILDDQVYDSLQDDVASYADDAVRALSKAIEELEYLRNQVGNDPAADAARKRR